MTQNHFVDVIDDLDACIFTGDHLTDSSNREMLQEFIDRWQRALNVAKLEGNAYQSDIVKDIASQL